MIAWKLHNRASRRKRLSLAWAVLLALMLPACSLEKFAMKKVGDALTSSSGGNVFMEDNDPEFVGDALPFAIKLYETLLGSMPDHPGLRLRTGSLYIMYANAFIQTPADMTPKAEIEAREFQFQRAKNLYLRGRDMLLKALELKNPKLLAQLKEKAFTQALAPYTKADVPLLYWTAAGWVAAFAIDPFDMRLGITLPQAAAIMERILQLDENYNQGTIHSFYILYYGSLPEYMGGSAEKARSHFTKAVAAGGDQATSPLLSLATTLSIKEQNVEEFKSLLDRVLAVDPNVHPENRLLTILNQRKARWLLDHLDDYFLLEEGEEEENREEKH